MRVWFVNHYALPPERSTSSSRHFSLAEALIKHGNQAVIVAASFDHFAREQRATRGQPRLREEIIDGVPFVWLRTPSYGGNGLSRLKNMLTFAWRVRRIPVPKGSDLPDAIVASSPHPFGCLAAQRLSRKIGCPFVLEIRDLWPESLTDIAGMSPRNLIVVLVDKVVRFLYGNADAIVVLMPGGGEAVARRGGSASRVTYIPNGIDLGRVPVPRPPAPSHGFTLMYAGAHGVPNALDDILGAADLVDERGRDEIRIRLVGDGSEKLRLVDLAKQEGLGNVVFEDPVPRDEVFGVLQEADAFVATMLPSPVYRFGISFNKLFDYMATERPVILANAAANDVVTEARAGFTVPAGDPVVLADAICAMADTDPGERAAMGRRGREYVEAHHNYAHLALVYESLLQDLMDQAMDQA